MRARASLVAVLCLSLPVSAQWSKSPGTTLSLADGAWEQVQAKVVRAPDGGAYVSWFDSDPSGTPAFGYDVRLQRLDPSGNEVWAQGGVLVADRGFSSTEDYGLDVDAAGNALLAFRDTRFGGTRITVTVVDSTGAQTWGPSGVQVTSSGTVFSPRVADAGAGGVFAAWTSGSGVVAQRLDASGAPQWGAGFNVSAAAGGTAFLCAIRGTSDGGVIVTWTRQSGSFFSPRHLHAQKLDAAGAPQWGAAGLAVFDGGSLQIAYYPSFVTDGSGGGVFHWYSLGAVAPEQVHVQRVLANGSEVFPHNGVTGASTIGTRAGAAAAYDATTGETYLFWVEMNSGQSMFGLSGQRFDAAGARQWGPQGIAYVPLSSSQISQVQCQRVGAGAAVAWSTSPSFGNDTVQGLHVDPSGAALHAVTALSSTPASVDDLASDVGALGELQVVWHDDRSGTNDVFGQNLGADGTLGPVAGVLWRNGGSNPDTYTCTPPVLGGSVTMTVDVSSTGHPLGLVAGFLAPAVIPFGADTLLVDLTHPTGDILGLLPVAGPLATHVVPIPGDPAICGLSVYTQGVHLGPTSFVLSNAQDLYLGI
jgi:hypothetical protein